MSSQKRVFVSVLTAASLVLGFSLVANSGPLSPPAGSVTPTGRTLTEVYDAALAAGMSGGGVAQPVSDVREVVLMRVTSSTLGEIKGEDTMFNMTEAIRVFGVEHEVLVPIGAGGLPTGSRQHRPLTVRKQIDKATPLLYDTLTRNAVLDEVELYFYKADLSAGVVLDYYKITLENARISSIRADTEGVANNRFTHDEYVSFVYQRITWEHLEGGTIAQDENPLAGG